MTGPLRSAAREAVWVCAIALTLSIAYNALTAKGIFATSASQRPASPPATSGTPATAELISLELAKSLFDAGGALFVDSRHAYDYRLGHIRDAINIPLKEAPAVIATLDRESLRTIVVYCDGIECNSSLEVGSQFVAAGFKDVRIFFGGWKMWTDSGYPSESTPS